MTTNDQGGFKPSPAHSAALALGNALRCPRPKCGHLHRHDPCRFPGCDCPPRAERPGHGPIVVTEMSELEGGEP